MICRSLVAVAGVAALAALVALPASAQYGPDVDVARPSVRRGEPVVVSGSGFAPTVPIDLTLVPAAAGCGGAAGGVPLGSVLSTEAGTFTAQVTVPTTAAPGAYLVCARHLDVVAAIPISVLGSAVGSPGGSGGGGPAPSLPRTGSEPFPSTAVGAGLVTVGGLMVLAVRRRTEHRGATTRGD